MSDMTERVAFEADVDDLVMEHLHRTRRGTTAPQHHSSAALSSETAAIELVANRDVRPPFLSDAKPGAFSKQVDIILPITSPNARLVKAAAKGSTELAAFKKEEARARIARDNTDVSKSDLSKIMKSHDLGSMATAGLPLDAGGGGEEAELAALQEKIRVLKQTLAPLKATDDNRQVSRALVGSDSLHRQAKKEALVASAADYGQSAAEREALRRVRQSLPIYKCRAELLRYIAENPVVIVMGETGSGKTTQLVQYLLESNYARDDKLIGCTQPRRLAAIGVATRVAEEVGCTLGTTVGYSIHLDDMTTSLTRLRFMTDGVLLREVVKDPELSKYSVIVMDEAHERSIDTDILLGVLKDVCRRRSDLKVIVTSATMNLMKFSQFFDNAPIYEIAGKTFDVDVQYISEMHDEFDYVHEAVMKVVQIHKKVTIDHDLATRQSQVQTSEQQEGICGAPGTGNGGDILVFMTGRDDVHGTCALIQRRLREQPRRADGTSWEESLLLVPVMSEAAAVGSRQASALFDRAPPGKRKCVVATNVAETSLTIDGIRFVVDCGMMKTNVFHPKFGMNTLKRYPTSQAQANQRRGRAGRTATGVCYRLYTKYQFECEMIPTTVPEIQRSSVDTVVLLLKSIGVDNLNQFEFIDPPPEVNLRSSLWHLWLLGALCGDDGRITALGRNMLEFPLTPSLSNIVLHSASTEYRCSQEALSIVAMLSADCKGLFETTGNARPEQKGGHQKREEDIRQAHSRFYDGESDHLTLLRVYEAFIENRHNRMWCRENFLNHATLERALSIREQLADKAARLGLPLLSCGKEGLDVVRKCLVHGYTLQVAVRAAGKWTEYQSLLNPGVVCHILPTSSILSAGSTPTFVVYEDLMVTSKEYLVTVTAVDPQWVIAAGRGLYRQKGLLATSAPAAASAPELQWASSSGSNPAATGTAKRSRDGHVIPSSSSLLDGLLSGAVGGLTTAGSSAAPSQTTPGPQRNASAPAAASVAKVPVTSALRAARRPNL